MATPPDLMVLLVLVSSVMLVVCMGVFLYWAECATRRCDRLVETIRTMGLAASSPLLAAKLEQQRLRQSPGAPGSDKARGEYLTHIHRQQHDKAQERYAQNRAAHPATPAKRATMRYVAPDDDLLPPADGDQPTPVPSGMLRPGGPT